MCLAQVGERGSAPKGGWHSTTLFNPLCSSSAQPCSGSLMVWQSTPKKWFLGARFLGEPPISLSISLSLSIYIYICIYIYILCRYYVDLWARARLQAKIESDGKAEQKSYDQYACWCEERTHIYMYIYIYIYIYIHIYTRTPYIILYYIVLYHIILYCILYILLCYSISYYIIVYYIILNYIV